LPLPRPVLDARERPASRELWQRRGFRLLIGAAACLLIVFAAVAWIYFTSPDRQQDQPVARISAQPPLTLAVRPAATPLALIATPSGLLVSDDLGSSWQRLLIQGGVKAIGVGQTDQSPIYLAGTHLWRGDLSGFQEIATDLPVQAVQAMAVDPADPNRVYAVVSGRGFFRSDDAGQQWVALGPDVPTDVTALAVMGGAQPLFFVATSQHGVFGSADGRSWSNANGFVNGALPTQAIVALVYDPHSGDRYEPPSGGTLSGALYAGTDLGLFKSIDAGQSWSPLPFKYPVAALGLTTSGERTMLAVDLNGNVYRSQDGGVSWR